MAVHHGKAPAIGIDLGTTCSCVGVYQDGKVEIIANALGNQTTPSYVAFTDSDVFIGEEAKSQAAMSPKNTFFDAKRLIGRRFTDQHVQSDMKHWPFTVVDQGGNPVLQAEYLGETRTITPEEVSSMVLTKMKETAEAYLGQEVNDVVITVPVYFDDDQRNATKDAGVIAGLNVLGVLNEHTAAALAYELHKCLPVEQNVLVIDIGGVTLNVAVLLIDDGLFEVKSTAGDTQLGGDAFDNRLVLYLIEEFKRVYDKDLTSNPRAVSQLRNAAERAKRTLSTSAEAVIEEEALYEGKNFHTIVTREQFDDLCSDLFTKLLEPVEKAIARAKMSKEQIDTVVAVGGSSRIPKIRELLQKAFEGMDLKMSIDPNEVVAYGAAVQAALLSGDHPDKVEPIVMIDVAPLSLGIETAGGVMANIIDRNIMLPTRISRSFTTFADNQAAVSIQVYEGERALTKYNKRLGRFDLMEILPAPRGVPKIKVSFDIDANGILTVTAEDESSGRLNDITISGDIWRPSKEDVNRMIDDAERHKADDDAQRERIPATNQLEHVE